METIGIIAEYNPFHNGHLYQIEEIKAKTGADNIVVIMSGDFVQRGAPAFTDKYLRTLMALKGGADFVFELPVSFAVSSAEIFASAGISLLTALEFIDGICFGAECNDLSKLDTIAQILCNPTTEFHAYMKSLLAKGISYPKARSESLRKLFPDLLFTLSSPNDILAVEYLKAIKLQNSPLIPLMIKRNDNGYHQAQNDTYETEICDSCFTNITTFASAEFIRQLYKKTLHNHISFQTGKETALKEIRPFIPESTCELLYKFPDRFPVTTNDFTDLLYYRLLHLTENDIKISDMNQDIYHRIRQHVSHFSAFTDFIELLKTKQYTYTRISRILIHLLLDINSSTIHDETGSPAKAPYARLLGFRREKSHLLRRIRKIPVITKPADGMKILANDPFAQKLYQKDLFASNLYRQIQKQAIPENEYFQKPIIL